MKKLIALLMAALLVFAFAGCAKTNDDGSSTNPDANNNANADVDADADADVKPGTDDKLPEDADDAESDLAYVLDKGTLVVGITEYKPMDYKEEGSDEWTGFDAEFAKAFAEELGVEVEFIEIDWDNKVFELDTKEIDCIWNGMTITPELEIQTTISNPYVRNAQVVVMAADKVANYKDAASMADLSFAVEAGSAGEKEAENNGYDYTSLLTQADALMEVQSGTADACIIDITMANAMTGEGTSYAKLAKGIELSSEEYGVSFRKNSDLVNELNKFMTENKDSVLTPLATKYELTLAF